MDQKEIEEVSLFGNDEPGESQAVEDAVVADAAPTFDMPDKFKGKSVEDVAESYINLEKESGRRANEIGELRKLTDQILQQQIDRGGESAKVEDINDDVGFDEFIDNPVSAVDKALSKNPRLQALEASLEKQNREVAHQRMVDRHSDADDVVTSPEFQKWLNESPSRLRSLQRAHTELDADLAGDMLDMYKTTRKVATEEAVTERDAKVQADLKKAVVETGGTRTKTERTFKRAELIRLKMTDPHRYSAMSDEIHQAYADGRVK
jgi:hypothetical protein